MEILVETLDELRGLPTSIKERQTVLHLRDIRGKNLECETLAGYKNLQTLFFWNFEFERIPEDLFNEMAYLESVIFLDGRLKEIPKNLFRNNPELSRVCIEQNFLERLPKGLFDNNPKLTSVKFSRNNLKTLPVDLFKNTPDLACCSFNNNKLVEVHPSLCMEKSNLWEVNLSNNSLTDLPDMLFFGCNTLAHCNLYNNPFRFLPEHVIPENCNLVLGPSEDLRKSNLQKNLWFLTSDSERALMMKKESKGFSFSYGGYSYNDGDWKSFPDALVIASQDYMKSEDETESRFVSALCDELQANPELQESFVDYRRNTESLQA